MNNKLNEVLEDALLSDTMDEVLKDGEVIEDITEYERYFSDADGGESIRLRIVKYNDKIYCHKEKVIDYPKYNYECIAFYVLQ